MGESAFVDGETWDVEINVGDEKKKVTLREISAADAATIDDATAIGEDGEFRLNNGTKRLLEVQKSVVSWELDKPCTPETVAALKPKTFRQIASHVDKGKPASPTAPAKKPAREK